MLCNVPIMCLPSSAWSRLSNCRKSPQKRKAAGFATIFAENRLVPTIWLWVGIFMGFLSLYFVISWVTKLASQAGLTLENAIYVGAILNFGAFLGTLLMGKLSNRFPQGIVGAVFLVLAAALLVVFGTVHMSLGIVLFTAFLMGMAIYGGFNSFYGLAASLYPAAVRGTGVGWAMGAGRFWCGCRPVDGWCPDRLGSKPFHSDDRFCRAIVDCGYRGSLFPRSIVTRFWQIGSTYVSRSLHR
ncbi:aromatic acid/H+ symport family MFS transporter [Ochrobactrum haematophilum]|uniref:Aromatic acid/H+ symport family MFS transporter n=1 Tax=Brucella haematophila TaxID=419474 RepID=A0ABX1DUF6_9HYPH|nr:aromatic acid/H+ symport family MFS transporter [Brucella haematophila]